jgi:GTP-binding protein YchF
MEIAIIGLPQSGKTTVFNAATRGAAQVAAYANKPNIGVAKVPDQRLDVLDGIFRPRRKVSAEVTYVDIPAAPEGLGKTQGISGEYLNLLQRADALLIVARAFEDPSVPHVADSIDAFRDIDTMLYELTFADLEILERRLARVADSFKGARVSERDALNKEQASLQRIKSALEAGTHVRDQGVTDDERRLLAGFQLLMAKPLLIVVNVGEDQLADIPEIEQRLSSEVETPRIRTAALCGKLEMELAQMEPAEEAEFRQSLGVTGESGLSRMIRLSYEALDLISFLTVGDDEVRAWPITRGTVAVKAAGKIHSDLERGFIRGEVVSYEDLTKCGSLAEARKHGVLRQEGKTYVVKDGDIMHVLFNV